MQTPLLPWGPFLATADEISDVSRLTMWLKVNGETRQNSSIANMIFNVPTLVSYVSQFMTLLPGDVISTGTPACVGLGMSPPRYLKDGDFVELKIRRYLVPWGFDSPSRHQPKKPKNMRLAGLALRMRCTSAADAADFSNV